MIAFPVISEHWDGTGRWKPSLRKTPAWSCRVNVVASDSVRLEWLRISLNLTRNLHDIDFTLGKWIHRWTQSVPSEQFTEKIPPPPPPPHTHTHTHTHTTHTHTHTQRGTYIYWWPISFNLEWYAGYNSWWQWVESDFHYRVITWDLISNHNSTPSIDQQFPSKFTKNVQRDIWHFCDLNALLMVWSTIIMSHYFTKHSVPLDYRV